jgi:hypothetical protein
MMRAFVMSMKNAPNHRDDEEREGRGPVALGDGLHDGEGAGRGRQPEADVSRGHHRRVVVLAHDPEGDPARVEDIKAITRNSDRATLPGSSTLAAGIR